MESRIRSRGDHARLSFAGMLARLFKAILGCTVTMAAAFAAQSFTIVVYNVENLHDADGVAVYDDYQPALYGSAHVVTKVTNVASVLARFRNGEGPDIVLLQEVEIDQTPGRAAFDPVAFVKEQSTVRLASLKDAASLPEAWRDAPAEAWLLKALQEAGLRDYHVYVGSDAPSPEDLANARAIKCVTLSKFPAIAVREYPIESARNILETEFEIDGQRLHVFNNHWKSGAGNAEMEQVRVQNAEVLRARLNQILTADPQADIVLGGDFNAHYNQKPRYVDMPRTGLNDVIGAQGSEVALQKAEAQFFNLWFELPATERGSDVFRGEWGTLMHLIVSRGLYDWAGVQYQDNSFRVARLSGVNSGPAGEPIRWDGAGPAGSGFSDHLPIYAHFRTVDTGRPDLGMPLDKPANEELSNEVRKVDYASVDLNLATAVDALPTTTDLRDGSWNRKIFLVEGPSTSGKSMSVQVRGQVYDIYAPQREALDRLRAQHVSHRRVKFYGELSTYKGNWQFVVQDVSWVP